MLNIQPTPLWQSTFPDSHIGFLLVKQIDNSKRPTPLDEHKIALIDQLRATYGHLDRAGLLAERDILAAYKTYYRRFKKTYHVQLQLESVLHKGKWLPNVSPLVDAGFAAELETCVLTAAHDYDQLQQPVRIDVTQTNDPFTQMNGKTRQLPANDMLMADAASIVCTIIYGQDQRTPVTPATRNALYVAYAPAGIPSSTVLNHLATIEQNVKRFAGDALESETLLI